MNDYGKHLGFNFLTELLYLYSDIDFIRLIRHICFKVAYGIEKSDGNMMIVSNNEGKISTVYLLL